MKTKFCPKCRTNKPISYFYNCHSKPDGLYGWCKVCFNLKNNSRRDELKEKAIIYKGGKCIRCGLTFPQTPSFIFDFHHIDPSTKEAWKSIRKWGWERIQREVDKCVLVCSNCHRYLEYGSSVESCTQNSSLGG